MPPSILETKELPYMRNGTADLLLYSNLPTQAGILNINQIICIDHSYMPGLPVGGWRLKRIRIA